MRLKLTLRIEPHSTIPVNYAYALQALVYKVLEQANPELSAWLHDNGFDQEGKKRFKLFTYSALEGWPFRIDKEKQTISYHTNRLQWVLSFAVPQHVETFVQGLFTNQVLDLSISGHRMKMTVEGIEVLTPPRWSTTMRYRALRPICIATKIPESPYPQYIEPEHSQFEAIFMGNIANKLNVLPFQWPFDETPSVVPHLSVLSAAKKRKFDHIKRDFSKSSSIIGYEFDFELTAPIAWHAMGFYAGFGSYNAAGFGFVEVIK